MTKRKIPFKNYVIVGVLVLVLVLGSLYLCSWYKTIREYNLTKSVLTDTINIIELETLESYLLDNSDFIMYISDSSDQEVKSFEKKLKKYINNNSLNNEVIYLDIKDYDKTEVLKKVLNYSSEEYSKLKRIPLPNMLVFENGRIVKILYVVNTKINRNDAIDFIKENI